MRRHTKPSDGRRNVCAVMQGSNTEANRSFVILLLRTAMTRGWTGDSFKTAQIRRREHHVQRPCTSRRRWVWRDVCCHCVREMKKRFSFSKKRSFGRGRRIRTLNKGFGDPRVTITPCPYCIRNSGIIWKFLPFCQGLFFPFFKSIQYKNHLSPYIPLSPSISFLYTFPQRWSHERK